MTEPTEPQSEDTVEIHEASIEDIDAYLDAAQAEEEGIEAVPDEENESEAVEGSEEEIAEEPVEETDKPVASDPEALRKHNEELRAENEKLLKRVNDSQLYIQRRNNEIGQLRRDLVHAKSQLEAGLDEKYQIDPKAAMQDQLKINQIDDQINQNDREAAVLETRRIVDSNVKPYPELHSDIIQVLRDDGIPDDAIQAFAVNPYANALPETLIQLCNRARERRIAINVFQENKQLREQLAKAKQAPDRVLKGVERAARQPTRINGSNGSSVRTTDLEDIPVTQLSDAELEHLSKQLRQR